MPPAVVAAFAKGFPDDWSEWLRGGTDTTGRRRERASSSSSSAGAVAAAAAAAPMPVLALQRSDADELAASLRLRDELWTSVGFALPAAAADEDGAAALPVLRKLCADWGPGVATPEAHLRRHGGDVDLAVASLLTECVGRGAMRRLGFGELPSADGSSPCLLYTSPSPRD